MGQPRRRKFAPLISSPRAANFLIYRRSAIFFNVSRGRSGMWCSVGRQLEGRIATAATHTRATLKMKFLRGNTCTRGHDGEARRWDTVTYRVWVTGPPGNLTVRRNRAFHIPMRATCIHPFELIAARKNRRKVKGAWTGWSRILDTWTWSTICSFCLSFLSLCFVLSSSLNLKPEKDKEEETSLRLGLQCALCFLFLVLRRSRRFKRKKGKESTS